jgi:predicted enzyme related to lactoylglutathione lyase
MSTAEDRSTSNGGAASGVVDQKLEVLVIPVSDVDRSKEFYAKAGWRLDADLASDGFRLIQFTPPGSGCSIQFGANLTVAPPGSDHDMLLAVSDLQAARDDLVSRGVQVSKVFHCAKRAASTMPKARPNGSPGRRPITPATARTPRSVTRTGTAG